MFLDPTASLQIKSGLAFGKCAVEFRHIFWGKRNVTVPYTADQTTNANNAIKGSNRDSLFFPFSFPNQRGEVTNSKVFFLLSPLSILLLFPPFPFSLTLTQKRAQGKLWKVCALPPSPFSPPQTHNCHNVGNCGEARVGTKAF